MNFKGHLVGGCVAGGAAIAYTYPMYHSPLVPVSCGIFAVIASLYPDTDTKSIPSKIFFVGGLFLTFALIVTFKWLLAAIVVGMMVTSALAPHRGITHSLAFAGAFCFVLPTIVMGYFIAPLCVSGFAGYLSHLILDRHFRFI